MFFYFGWPPTPLGLLLTGISIVWLIFGFIVPFIRAKKYAEEQGGDEAEYTDENGEAPRDGNMITAELNRLDEARILSFVQYAADNGYSGCCIRTAEDDFGAEQTLTALGFKYNYEKGVYMLSFDQL